MTYAEITTAYQEETKDSTTANTTTGRRRINRSYLKLCAASDYYWTERELTFTTVASQQAYDLNRRFREVRSVRVDIGADEYVLDEIPSAKDFDLINSQLDTSESDYPIHYHIRDEQILIWPTPATSSYTVTVLGHIRPLPMALTTDVTGTATATNGDATVTDSGTSFSFTARDGRQIIIDDIPYNISSVTDTSNLEMAELYQGTTGSGKSYRVGDVPILPVDFHDILWMDAALFYYGNKKESRKMYEALKDERNELESRLISSTKSRTSSNVLPRRGKFPRNPNYYPRGIG